MLDFVLGNYWIFIVIAVVLLLGLFGYMMDRKKYDQYRQEIINSDSNAALYSNVSEIAPAAPAPDNTTESNQTVVESPNTVAENPVVAEVPTNITVMDDTPFDESLGDQASAPQTLNMNDVNVVNPTPAQVEPGSGVIQQ